MAGGDTNDPRNIWAAPERDDTPGGGIGTYDDPFASIQDALKKAGPGQSVILLPGVYDGDLTVEISGTESSPIYIASYKTGEAVVENGCWYFYDACDLVVSGVTFRYAKRGAISVVGQCLRNRFHSIKFVDCGTDGNDSCTFYFGGSGGRFNIVEDCEFSRAADIYNINDAGNAGIVGSAGGIDGVKRHAAAGLMISDGGDGDYLLNHVVRKNRFNGYDRAIIAGSGNSSGDFESGHLIERNIIDNCRVDGITVKCGDVQIRGNTVSNCANAGINMAGGGYSVIEGNSIADCGAGISASGEGHSAGGNSIVNCKSAAIAANGEARSFFIYENTLVNCAIAPPPGDGFIVGENTSILGDGHNFVSDNVSDDAGDDDSYIRASIPDAAAADNDGGGDDQAADSDGLGGFLNYMFNME